MSACRYMVNGEFIKDDAPFSCCNVQATRPCVHHDLRNISVHRKLGSHGTLYTDGCNDKLEDYWTTFVLDPVFGALLVVLTLQARLPLNPGLVSRRPTTVKWRQFSQSNRHSTIGTPQTQYHEALPSSANVQSHLTLSFVDDGNASWYWVCGVPMVEWRWDCENCRHLTVVGFYDTGPWLHVKDTG